MRTAVIGLGNIGAVHARLLSTMASAELVICCDADPDRRRQCPQPSRFTTDLEEALSIRDLEAAIIATPEHLHRQPSIAAIERGIAVLCEKPIASTLKDADAMIDAAVAASVTLVVGHVLRFEPRYAAVKEAAERGQLGPPIHLVARANGDLTDGRRYFERTSLALCTGIHDIDILRWLGGEVTRVYAEGASLVLAPGKAFDSVVATLSFASGAIGILEMSWALPHGAGRSRERTLSYVGTRACAYLSLANQGVEILGSRKELNNRSTDRNSNSSDATIEWPDVCLFPEVHGIPSGPFVAQLEHFLDVVRGNREPIIDPREAYDALATALAIDQSLTRGKVITLNG